MERDLAAELRWAADHARDGTTDLGHGEGMEVGVSRITCSTLREAAKLIEDLRWENALLQGVCPICGGDCASANPPVAGCPMQTENTKA